MRMNYVQKVMNLVSRGLTGRHTEIAMVTVSLELVKGVIQAFTEDFGPNKEHIRFDISGPLEKAMYAEMSKIPSYYNSDSVFNSMFEPLEYDKLPAKYPSGLYKLKPEARGQLVSAIIKNLNITIKVSDDSTFGISGQDMELVKREIDFLFENLVTSKYVHPDTAVPKAIKSLKKSHADSKLLFNLISDSTLAIVDAAIKVAYRVPQIASKVEDNIGSEEDALISAHESIDTMNREEITQDLIDFEELTSLIKENVLFVATEKGLELQGHVTFEESTSTLKFPMMNSKGKTKELSIQLTDVSRKNLQDIGEAAINQIIESKDDNTEEEDYNYDEEFEEI